MRLAIFVCALFILQIVWSERVCKDEGSDGDACSHRRQHPGSHHHHHRHRSHRHRTHYPNGTVLSTSSSESEEIFSDEMGDTYEPAGGENGCEGDEPADECEEENLVKVPEDQCADDDPADECKEENLMKVPEDKCEDDDSVDECKEENLTKVPEDKCEDDELADECEEENLVKVPEDQCEDDDPADECKEENLTKVPEDTCDDDELADECEEENLVKVPEDQCEDDYPADECKEENLTKVPEDTCEDNEPADECEEQNLTKVPEDTCDDELADECKEIHLNTVPEDECEDDDNDDECQDDDDVTTKAEDEVSSTSTVPDDGCDDDEDVDTTKPADKLTSVSTTRGDVASAKPSDEVTGTSTVPDEGCDDDENDVTTTKPVNKSLESASSVVQTSESQTEQRTSSSTSSLTIIPMDQETSSSIAIQIESSTRASTETTSTTLPKLSKRDCGRLKQRAAEYGSIMQKLTDTVGTLTDPTILNDQIQSLINRVDKITRRSRCELSVVDLLQDIWNVICQSWLLLRDILQQVADPDSDPSLIQPIIDQLITLRNVQQKVLEYLQPYAKAGGNTAQYDAIQYLSDRLSETLSKLKQPVEEADRSQIQNYANFAQEVVNAIDIRSGE